MKTCEDYIRALETMRMEEGQSARQSGTLRKLPLAGWIPRLTVSLALGSGCVPGTPGNQHTATKEQALASNCPADTVNVINVCNFATDGDGSMGNPWRGWENGTGSNGLNQQPAAAPLGVAAVEYYFPAGYYYQTSTITLQTGWTLRGAGELNSMIYSGLSYPPTSSYTGSPAWAGPTTFSAQTAFQFSNPPNISGNGYIHVSDLGIYNGDSSNNGAGFHMINDSYNYFHRLFIDGFAYGIALDGAEHDYIDECDIESQGVGGIWLVCNSDGNFLGGFQGGPNTTGCITNRVEVSRSQFNGPQGTGIIDDGGGSHVFRSCNFNGGTHAISFSAVSATSLSGSEFESQSSDIILFSYNSSTGSAGGYPAGLAIADNIFSCTSPNHVISNLYGSDVFIDRNFVDCGATAFPGQPSFIAATGNIATTSTMNFFDSEGYYGALSALNVGAGNTSTIGLGAGTTRPNTTLDVNGALATRARALAVTLGVNNSDLDPGLYSFQRLTGGSGAGAFSVGGFQSGKDGRVLYLFNATGQSMTIVNNDTGSSAANRILTLTNANVALRAGNSFATLIYSAADSRWILASTN